MTSKDYQMIADVIKGQKSYCDMYDDAELFRLMRTANSLASSFEDDNPRFNREKFLTACEIS